MNLIKLFILFAILCSCLLTTAQERAVRHSPADTVLVTSPNRQIQCRLFQQKDQLHFAVTYKNIYIIENSAMVMLLNDTVLQGKMRTSADLRYQLNERYPLLGAHATAINHCSGIKVLLQHQKMVDTLEVRVFNDGIAFRTILPADDKTIRIPDEATQFNIPAGSILWYHDLVMHYEGVHVKKEISQVQAGEWVAPPATYKLPQGVYASITEANLVNYAGMALQANGNNGLQIRLPQHQRASYPYRLRYSPEDTLRLQQPAAIAGTITTPWRVVIIGSDLNTLVNSDIIQDLCPQPDKTLFPQGIYTSWIKPGRAVWRYLDGGGNGSFDAIKKFTDDAATLGFEHNILEGFWARWGGDTLRNLIDYSREKKVGIWLWKHSKTLRNPGERQAFFKKCHDLGVTGLKIDFFDHEAKETIDLYTAILREAAENHLLLDFHGANKPSGLSRTWPNLLTSEAVKGMESSKLTDRATHETTITFTRCLAGPAEYTVMLFSERRQNTTWAHQIASAAILNAPLLTYAANPENILSNPAVAVIRDIPAVWDETIVLPGSAIGELAVYARRKGNKWFIAVMNGAAPQKLDIVLDFLTPATTYSATVVKDGNDGASVKIELREYSDIHVIHLDLVAGGGYIAELEPK